MTSLVLNTGFGGNTTDIQSTDTKTPLTVNEGGGNNTVNAGSPVNRLLDIVNLTVNGGSAGATVLNLYDQANADGYNLSSLGRTYVQTRPTYVVTDGSVTRNDALTMTFPNSGEAYNTTVVGLYRYTNIAGLNLYGGSSGNIFYIEGTAATTPLTVNAAINDRVAISDPTVRLDGIQGTVCINGGGNVNLSADDSHSTIGHTYTLTPTPCPAHSCAAVPRHHLLGRPMPSSLSAGGAMTRSTLRASIRSRPSTVAAATTRSSSARWLTTWTTCPRQTTAFPICPVSWSSTAPAPVRPAARPSSSWTTRPTRPERPGRSAALHSIATAPRRRSRSTPRFILIASPA